MSELPIIRDHTALMNYINQGNTVKYLFFWGHTPKQADQIGKECLSQWYPATFTVDGIDYPTAEHYMMAAKARLFDDQIILQRILNAKSPAQAKKLGRQIQHFDQVNWDKHCFTLVVTGNVAKFSQNPVLHTFLQNTKQRILVEASPRDRIWGIGLAADNPKAADPNSWRGKNLLGFALMEVRQRLVAMA